MKVEIHAVGMELPADARGYVEYRIFAAIGRFCRACERVIVRLELRGSTGPMARYVCSVTLGLTPGGKVRVRTTGRRLYAAIDAAAGRLARVMEQRCPDMDPASRGGGVTGENARED